MVDDDDDSLESFRVESTVRGWFNVEPLAKRRPNVPVRSSSVVLAPASVVTKFFFSNAPMNTFASFFERYVDSGEHLLVPAINHTKVELI